MTDQIHKIDAGWMMLMIASLAFFPGFSLLDKKSLSNIPYQQVFFVVGCMTIGGAAKASGVDKVIADLLMPLLSGGELYTSFLYLRFRHHPQLPVYTYRRIFRP